MLCSPLIQPLIQVQWASPVGGRTNRCGDDSNCKHIAIRVMSMAQIDDFFMYENRVEGKCSVSKYVYTITSHHALLKKYYLYLSLILCCSCTMNEDKKEMLGDDYRLYKATAAWELAQAVQEEDTTKIQKIIVDEHIPVDFREPKYSQTLLMLAVRTNKELSVKKLLELGADPNAHDDSTKYLGENAVIIASRFTRPSNTILKSLLEFGGNPNATTCGVQKNNEGNIVPIRMFALSYAVGVSFDKVKLLVDAGANIDYSTSTHETALESCMIHDRMDIMLYLLQKGANIHTEFYEVDFNRPNYPTFIVNILYKLRKCAYPLNSKEFQEKMKVVEFLKNNGLDYRNSPIPPESIEIIKNDMKFSSEEDFDHYLQFY